MLDIQNRPFSPRHNGEVVDSLSLLQTLVRLPAPAGQEDAVRAEVAEQVASLSRSHTTDAKGNLIVSLDDGSRPRVVVTAHMDEIAMIVQAVAPDGCLEIGPLGGIHPWKFGEGPVLVMGDDGPVDGVLSFGSIHSESPASVVVRASTSPLTWEMAYIFTGLEEDELASRGVRPGTRVVVHPSRRTLFPFGEFIGGYFLDDRSDLVAWLIAISELAGRSLDATFVATAAEEVGGEGALFALRDLRPDICIALELGPDVDDAPVVLSDQPTIWVTDSYSSMSAADGRLVQSVADDLGMDLQFQALSRGGSDASCAASHGLCARPITIGIPMANSHGFEIIHPGAMETVGRFTAALVGRICES